MLTIAVKLRLCGIGERSTVRLNTLTLWCNLMRNSSARIKPPSLFFFPPPQMMSKISMHGLILFCALKVVGLNLIIPLLSAHYNYSKAFRAAD